MHPRSEYARKWRAENRENLRTYNKKRREDNIEEFRKYERAKAQEYRASNPEARKKSERKEYQLHKEKHKARAIRWQKANVERNREIRRLIRHRRRGNKPIDMEYCRILYNDSCSYCGSKEKIQIDHIISLAKGGTNGNMNLTAACKSCNSSKQDKSLLEFMLVRLDR